MRRFLSLVAFLGILLLSSSASAAIVRDGTEFSIDLSAAHICWVLPHHLRIASDCEGLAPDAVEAELDAEFKRKTIATGLVRLERHGEEPQLAVVTVTKVDVFGSVAADGEAAKDYTTGAERELRKDLPLGARLRPSDVHMVKPGSVPLLRGVFTIDGLPESSDKKLSEQQVHHAVFTKNGGYCVVWVGRHNAKARLETLADAAAPTIAVTNPAGSRKQLEKTFESIFEIGFAVLSGIAILVGFIIAITRKSRSAMPAYAYPYAYSPPPPAYGPPSGPPSYHPPSYHPPSYAQPNGWQPQAHQAHPSGPPPSQNGSHNGSYGPPSVRPTLVSPSTPPPPPPPSYEPPKSWWDQPR